MINSLSNSENINTPKTNTPNNANTNNYHIQKQGLNTDTVSFSGKKNIQDISSIKAFLVALAVSLGITTGACATQVDKSHPQFDSRTITENTQTDIPNKLVEIPFDDDTKYSRNIKKYEEQESDEYKKTEELKKAKTENKRFKEDDEAKYSKYRKMRKSKKNKIEINSTPFTEDEAKWMLQAKARCLKDT